MAHVLRLEMSDAAFRRLEGLQKRFNVPDTDALIFLALGVMEAALDYVDDEGVLTVVDPKQAARNADDPNVELEFVNLKRETAARGTPAVV